jgi:hypothetical protein
LRCVSGISANNLETTLLWWQNKPARFLEQLDEEKRDALHASARSKLPALKAKLQERRQLYKEELEEKLHEKQRQKQTAELKHRA